MAKQVPAPIDESDQEMEVAIDVLEKKQAEGAGYEYRGRDKNGRLITRSRARRRASHG